MNPMDDLLARLADLEEWRNNLSIGDLPVKQIQDKLEQDWQPNAQTLLGAKSITKTMLGFDPNDNLPFELNGGIAAIVWPGGSRLSSVTTQAHGLSGTPTTAVATPISNTNMVPVVSSVTASNLLLDANTIDGTSPVAGFSRNVYWFAIRIL
jgi:hypothetical protein